MVYIRVNNEQMKDIRYSYIYPLRVNGYYLDIHKVLNTDFKMVINYNDIRPF
ncbi:hypothetical protein KKH3_44050 [Pectobacterium actinidiae]|nr:hypothetical protein KKH3_44050 [Pectobacterium actinidiae]